jgi:hypothetical protein
VASSQTDSSKTLFTDDCAGKSGWIPKQSVAGEWVGL